MNDLKVTGKQNFTGVDIPVVLGGFGDGGKSISDKTIAEIHGMKVFHVRELIGNNLKRFADSVDIIDLKKDIVGNDNNLLFDLGYSHMQISKAEHIYLLSERGYAKLIKIMDTDLAWEVHDKLMDEYFELREDKAKAANIDRGLLSPEMQMTLQMAEIMAKQELEQKQQREEQKRQAEKMERLDDKLDAIKEVVALRPNAWRKETGAIINKIALLAGGYEHIRLIREESYRILEERMHVALNIRLTNKKKTLSLNGVTKSKLDKINQLDVIEEDPKLIEGYISVIKDMALKYGIAGETGK